MRGPRRSARSARARSAAIPAAGSRLVLIAVKSATHDASARLACVLRPRTLPARDERTARKHAPLTAPRAMRNG
jgi:hypothetical protein